MTSFNIKVKRGGQLSGAIADTPHGKMVNKLRPTFTYKTEAPGLARARRRKWKMGRSPNA